MAETTRMTTEQVVGYLLEGEGPGLPARVAERWVVQQLMEAEVSELVGAARGERAPEERLTHRNGSEAARAPGRAPAARERGRLPGAADRRAVGERSPATAAKLVQAYVSQLRRRLGRDAIAIRGPAQPDLPGQTASTGL